MRRVYYWLDGPVPNFGDTLAHTLLNTFGVDHQRAQPKNADLVVTGSVLEHMPSGWGGQVLGAGKIRRDSDIRVPLRNASILAVRGPLTARGLRGDYVLGDPGLLAPYIIDRMPATCDLGVVRHWSDDKITRRFAYGRVIEPNRGAVAVMSDIAQCKRIVTSSLHGAIVADALGIPRQAEPFDSEFKWHDYAAALGEDPHFHKMHSPSQSRVERIQADLHELFQTL